MDITCETEDDWIETLFNVGVLKCEKGRKSFITETLLASEFLGTSIRVREKRVVFDFDCL